MRGKSIFGIGVDIIEVGRIKSSIERNPEIVKKVFTKKEIEYCNRNKNRNARYICYGQRFAAKEAVSKAMGTGLGRRVFLTEIEIGNQENGKPVVRLYGRSKDFAVKNNIVGIEISISGTKDHAVAFCIAAL